MTINVDILDQRVRKIAEDFSEQFQDRLEIKAEETTKLRSTAFVFMAMKTVLDLSDEETLDCLTEGFDDFGLDAMHISDIEDDEFVVTVAQAKYNNSLKDAAGDMFPEVEGVTRIIPTVQNLFYPDAVIPANTNLAARIEAARSLVRDGYLPKIRVLLCNNGAKWSDNADSLIQNEILKVGDALSWEHVNHDRIIELLQAQQPVDEQFRLIGKAVIENFDFCRVLVGRIAVEEVAALFNRKGDRLLERNIRRFLGMQNNRVNEGIAETLNSEAERKNFYFFNNGITVLCQQISHGAQTEDLSVKLRAMQVINGGQTCKTIQQTLAAIGDDADSRSGASVLIRIYELPAGADEMVRSITYRTNSQNPVDLRDLQSNDSRQKGLQTAMQEIGFTYHRFRSEDSARKKTSISSAKAAEAILSVWRHRPYHAKYHGREHFGKFYDSIFRGDLTAAQAVLAVLVLRFAEAKRRKPPVDAPECLAYASYFVAMLMGRYLLEELGHSLADLNHNRFADAKAILEQKEEAYFDRALRKVDETVSAHFGGREVSLQELASVFRGGALMQGLLS